MNCTEAIDYFKRRKTQYGLADNVQQVENCAVEALEKVRKLAVGMHPCSDELRVFDSDLDNLLKMVGEIK